MSRKVKDPPLGVVDHMEMADTLLQMREQSVDLLLQVSKGCGVTHRATKDLYRIGSLIDRVRSDLENRGIRDHGDKFSNRVYYPRQPELPQE